MSKSDDAAEILGREFPADSGSAFNLEAVIRTDTVRWDCAFCVRERSALDDNHAPDCPYWDFFGPLAGS